MMILKDWSKFDLKNDSDRKKLMKGLQFFLAKPDLFIPAQFNGTDAISKKFKEQRKPIRAAMQAFATLNDFPATAKETIEKFHEIPLYDMGFEQIFDIRDYSSSRKDGFAIDTVTSPFAFKKVLVGEKIKVYQMSGDRDYVFFDFYGSGLNWHRSLFDDQDYWTIEDNALEFRNEAFRIRAQAFYTLLEAAANAKAQLAWQAHPDGVAAGNRGYLAGRDAATLNLAAQTILLNCANKGYGISPESVSFIVLAPLQLRGRIRQALNYGYDNVVGSPTHIDYNFKQITTTMLTTTDQFHVILPKKKFKGGYRMNLTTFTDFDILSYVDTVAGWMRFGGAVGDSDQIERCAIA